MTLTKPAKIADLKMSKGERKDLVSENKATKVIIKYLKNFKGKIGSES